MIDEGPGDDAWPFALPEYEVAAHGAREDECICHLSFVICHLSFARQVRGGLDGAPLSTGSVMCNGDGRVKAAWLSDSKMTNEICQMTNGKCIRERVALDAPSSTHSSTL